MSTSKDNLYIGRQPIFDRLNNQVAYELLYRSAHLAEAQISDNAVATAEVIRQTFKRTGLNAVLGKSAGFLNVDAEMLSSNRIDSLPADRVVLELLETVEINEGVIERCCQLKQRGFRLALDDVSSYDDRYEPLFEMVDIIKIDLQVLDQAALAALVHRLKPYSAKLLAEKVESRERVRECMALGFKLFQGFALARPSVLIS